MTHGQWQTKWGRAHYRRNKQYYVDKASRYRKELRARVSAIKENTPCADCGVQYPHYVMDFDHVRGKKLGEIAVLCGKGSWKRVQQEMAKCEIVCANCHRERTQKRIALSSNWQDSRL